MILLFEPMRLQGNNSSILLGLYFSSFYKIASSLIGALALSFRSLCYALDRSHISEILFFTLLILPFFLIFPCSDL